MEKHPKLIFNNPRSSITPKSAPDSRYLVKAKLYKLNEQTNINKQIVTKLLN